MVVIKIKNVSAFIAEFSPPSLCMSQKKKEKKRKRGIQMLQKNYFVMCMQAGQKELQLYSNQMIFPLNNLPITSVVVVIILLLPTKKRWYFSLIVQGCFFI